MSYCFKCTDKHSSAHTLTNSWRYGELSRLLELRTTLSEVDVLSETDDKLSGFFPFHTSSNFIEDVENLFLHIRQIISQIQLSSETFTKFQHSTDLRDVICSYFECLKISMLRSNECTQDFLKTLVDESHKTIIFLEHLKAPRRDDLVTALDGTSELLHLHLDIYWELLQILYILDRKYNIDSIARFVFCRSLKPEQLSRNILSQYCDLVMWEFLSATSSSIETHADDYKRYKAFVCPCLTELFSLFAIVLNSFEASESFWCRLHEVFEHITGSENFATPEPCDSTLFYTPLDFPIKQPLVLCFSILDTLTDVLHEVARLGNTSEISAILKFLLKQSLTQTSVIHINTDLRCCLHVTSRLPPSTEVTLLIWEYFYRRLNENFSPSSNAISGVLPLSNDFTKFLDGCKECCSSSCEISENASSFWLFLRILSMSIQRSSQSTSDHEWKHIQGRFYTKFYRRKLEELTELGLMNFSSLFIVLYLSTNVVDVCHKLMAFYSMIDENKMVKGKRLMIWKGQFSLIKLCADDQNDVSWVTNSLSHSFDVVCRNYGDAVDRGDQWTLIAFYLDSLRKLSDNIAGFRLISHLLGDGLKLLLPQCEGGALEVLLDFVLHVVTKLRIALRQADNSAEVAQLRELSDKLWQTVYPYIKKQALKTKMASLLADISLMFCMISQKLQPPSFESRQESLTSCFEYFAFNVDVNPKLTCRFIGNAINVITTSIFQIDNCECQLIKAWLRCYLASNHIDSSDLKNLNSQMMKLSSVANLLQQSAIEIEDRTNEQSICHFFNAIGIIYRRTEGFLNKVRFRDQVTSYFTNLTTSALSICRNNPVPQTFLGAFRLIAELIRHCSCVLYISSIPNSELPQLLDLFILPRSLFNVEKSINPALLTALREDCSSILLGLGELQYSSDPYISRRLRDLIIALVNKFPIKNEATVQHHPLMRCFHHLQESGQAVQLRKFITDTLRTARLTHKHSSSDTIMQLLREMEDILDERRHEINT